ncbi:MAG: archease [Deltaproteobacteria bacterium]|nr:archease [Deltaproteobacteria bacterium]
MPYRALDDIGTADAAFEAWGATPEEVFAAAADATLNVMVEDPAAVAAREQRHLTAEAESLDLLLLGFLNELLYLKDAERLLLRVTEVRLQGGPGHWRVEGEARGEEIDPDRHALVVDVKAVTLHRLRVERTQRGWEATVVVDV